MTKVFPIPLYNFIRIAAKNGGVHPSKIHHLLPWMIKFVLFEPLRICEVARFGKKIDQHKIITDPLFILGHYRSGTTYLQRLLVQDTQFGFQSVFQSGLPEVMLGFEKVLKPLLSAVTKWLNTENKFHKVPFTWDFPGEEDVALTAFGFKDSLHWGNLFPETYEDYFNRYVLLRGTPQETEAWKQNYLYFVRKLSIKNGNKPLILKSPPNTARIPVLLEMFPEAKFIHIYRDPYDVFASCKRFWQIINKYYILQSLSNDQITDICINSYASMMEQYLQSRQMIAPERRMEISFEELIRKPMKQLEVIYHRLQLGDFSDIKAQAERFVRETRHYKQCAYHLTTQEKQLIDKHWGKFLMHWHHPKETEDTVLA